MPRTRPSVAAFHSAAAIVASAACLCVVPSSAFAPLGTAPFDGLKNPFSRLGLKAKHTTLRHCESYSVTSLSMRSADDDRVGTTKRSKNVLWAPATSLISWREYRARLVKGETPYYMRRASSEVGIWAHELSQLEPGCLLIESPQYSSGENRYDTDAELGQGKRVILLVKNSEKHGSQGLILNQPTPCEIGDLTRKMADFSGNTIYYGGEGKKSVEGQRAKGDLHTVHSVRGLKGGEELIDGVFVGADVRQALRLVSLGLASPTQFKFFYSCSRWQPGELEKELAQGKWVPAAASRDIALRPSSHWEKPLWRLLLEVLGGRHSLMARELYGDI